MERKIPYLPTALLGWENHTAPSEIFFSGSCVEAGLGDTSSIVWAGNWGVEGEAANHFPHDFFVATLPAKKLAWRPISACLHIPQAIFRFFRKRNPHPKRARAAEAEPLERPLLCTLDKTPQAEAASAHACSISIALVRFSPHSHSSLAPHGSLAQLATMFEASSLPKVIRSLSLYSPEPTKDNLTADATHPYGHYGVEEEAGKS